MHGVHDGLQLVALGAPQTAGGPRAAAALRGIRRGGLRAEGAHLHMGRHTLVTSHDLLRIKFCKELASS